LDGVAAAIGDVVGTVAVASVAAGVVAVAAGVVPAAAGVAVVPASALAALRSRFAGRGRNGLLAELATVEQLLDQLELQVLVLLLLGLLLWLLVLL